MLILSNIEKKIDKEDEKEKRKMKEGRKEEFPGIFPLHHRG